MNPRLFALVVLCVSACGGVVGAPAVAEPTPDTRPPAPTPVETIDGEVIGVDRVPAPDHLGGGLRVTVQTTPAARVVLQLAPGWFLDEHGMRFEPHGHVVAQGRRSHGSGADEFVASEVTHGGQTLRLRDESGRPLWRDQAPADAGTPQK